MHNLHLAVVSALSAEEARGIVESELMKWGNENNWYTIFQAVSDQNEMYTIEKGYDFYADLNTIEKINEKVAEWVNKEPYGKEMIDRFIKNESLKGYDWYGIEKYAAFMKEKSRIDSSTPVNVLDYFNFYDYQFDECGVTQLLNYNEPEPTKKWVVFIDMHS